MNKEELIYLEKPNLNQPYLFMGFEGWPNAGEVASFSIQFLIEKSGAKRFAYISHDSFYEISSLRPLGIIKEGRLVEINFPTNHFYYSKSLLSKDLIIFQGTEPHLHWNEFVGHILNVAQSFDVLEIITIGGTYDYIPHHYPTKVSAVFNHDELREKILSAGIGLTEYKGPISIHTFILEEARLRGIKAISLWVHAPQYLQVKNVKVVLGVLERLIDLIDEDIDLSALQIASEYFDHQVNQLIEKDIKLKEIVERIEEAYKEEQRKVISYPSKESSKEDNVIYIQAFLKRQDEEEKKED